MKKILIVDDSKLESQVLDLVLEDKYETQVAVDGAQAVEKATQWQPHLILMDVEMPEMNGYSACRTIRDSGFKAPIIFLSELTETDEKLKAYEAGADDYIGKPYDIKEMVHKIANNLERHKEHMLARENQQQAMQMANRSLVDLSYLGRIINYTQKISQCKTYDELASKTFGLLADLNLKSSLIFHNIDIQERVYFSGDNELPLERSMLQALKGARRILEFSKNRCAFNWIRASLLIKNMPEDEVENGAMKDYLGYMMNALEDAINGLLMQAQLKQTMVKYKDSNKQLKLAIMAIIEDFEQQLEDLFERPDIAQALPVDVEDLVVGLARDSTLKADSLFSTGFNMEGELDKVLEMFQADETSGQEPEADDDDAITLF